MKTAKSRRKIEAAFALAFCNIVLWPSSFSRASHERNSPTSNNKMIGMATSV